MSGEPASAVELVETAQHAALRAKRRRLTITLAIGLALVGYLAWKVDLREMAASLADVSLGLVLLGVFGNLLTPLLRAMRLKQAYGLRGNTIELAGMMGEYGLLNMVLPLKTGDVAFLALLKSRRVIPTIAEGLPRWVLLRAADLAAVLVLVLATSAFVALHPSLVAWSGLAAVGMVVVALLLVIAVLLLLRVPATETQPKNGFLAGRMWALRRGLAGIERPSLLAATGFWSLSIWGWQSLMVSIELSAFGLNLPAEQYWVIAVAILGISILPIHAPLAIGTLHAAQTGLLHEAFGVPLAPALAVAVGIHAAMVLTVVLQGALGAALVASSGVGNVRPVEP